MVFEEYVLLPAGASCGEGAMVDGEFYRISTWEEEEAVNGRIS